MATSKIICTKESYNVCVCILSVQKLARRASKLQPRTRIRVELNAIEYLVVLGDALKRVKSCLRGSRVASTEQTTGYRDACGYGREWRRAARETRAIDSTSAQSWWQRPRGLVSGSVPRSTLARSSTRAPGFRVGNCEDSALISRAGYWSSPLERSSAISFSTRASQLAPTLFLTHLLVCHLRSSRRIASNRLLGIFNGILRLLCLSIEALYLMAPSIKS